VGIASHHVGSGHNWWTNDIKLEIYTLAIAVWGLTLLTHTKWLFCRLIEPILGIVCKNAGNGLTS